MRKLTLRASHCRLSALPAASTGFQCAGRSITHPPARSKEAALQFLAMFRRKGNYFEMITASEQRCPSLSIERKLKITSTNDPFNSETFQEAQARRILAVCLMSHTAWSIPRGTSRNANKEHATRMFGDGVTSFRVARPERFELPTLCFEGRCSIQLSYGRILGCCLILLRGQF
jgi:hypothetical protein